MGLWIGLDMTSRFKMSTVMEWRNIRAAPFADTAYANAGAVYQIAGGTYSRSSVSSLSTTWWSGLDNTAEFGSEIELGDIDGDGTFDLLVSAPYQMVSSLRRRSLGSWMLVPWAKLSINPDWQIDGVVCIQHGRTGGRPGLFGTG